MREPRHITVASAVLLLALPGSGCRAPVDPERFADLERENRHLEEQLHDVRIDIAHMLCVQARVLRVEGDTVLLDKGAADELVGGVEFTIVADGVFKGWVVVTEVFERTCKARPGFLKRPVAAGDLASTAPSEVILFGG